MPGVIEVIIIMAIYNAIKKRGKKEADKALIEATFPQELQTQITQDYSHVVSLYVTHTHARALIKAKQAQTLLKPRSSTLFPSRFLPTKLNPWAETNNNRSSSSNKDSDTDTDPIDQELSRPGTPQPTDPANPVTLMDDSPPTSPSQPVKQRRTILSRLYTAGSKSNLKEDASPQASPSPPVQSPLKVNFDSGKATAEATAAILLVWAVVDALKKGARARAYLLEQAKNGLSDASGEESAAVVETAATAEDNGSGSSTPTVPSTNEAEEEGSASIGETEHDRQLQILTQLKTETLVSMLRMIQALLQVLGTRVGAAGPASTVTADPGKDDQDTESSSDGSDSAKDEVVLPCHNTSKYRKDLLETLKLGWGPVGMILEAGTVEEAVTMMERTRAIQDDAVHIDDDGVEKVDTLLDELYLVDCILEVLKSREAVVYEDFLWVEQPIV
ncbi:hypothetical protein BJ741DRAFT_579972 [Chytriomyces cf. hyalinus JEL632]|nr:hypothetical protein BJ741DRAFT_579972 [Chytriomyces cf. hyalinus JEL632]